MFRTASILSGSAIGLIVLALLVLMSSSIQAETYYVDASAGLDTNSGLAGSPWKSIDNGDAKGIVLPGDTVMVSPGVYDVVKDGPAGTRVVVFLERSGEPGNPITYKATGPGVVVDGGQTATSSTLIAGVIIGAVLTPPVVVHDLVIDGFEFQGVSGGVVSNAVHNLVVKNCIVHDTYGADPWGNSSYAIFDSGGVGNTYTDNVFYNCTAEGEANAFWIQVEGVGMNHVIARNLMYGFTGGIKALAVVKGCSGTKILNNTCDGGTNLVRPWGGASGTIVANNIIANASESGIGNWDGPGAVINSHNLFYDCSINYSGNVSQGPGDFTADPQFVAAGDYHLQMGSLAINAGVGVGLPFLGPAPDLGCFETTSTDAQPAVKGTVRLGSVPIPGVTIMLYNTTVSTVTGPDGQYRIPLVPGDYILQPVYRYPVEPADVLVTVVAGQETIQDFELNYTPQTYYVDPNGNDSGYGTQEDPWRSIDCGDYWGYLLPGDTVIVNPGVYDVQKIGTGPLEGIQHIVLLTVSGEPNLPITYKAAGPGVIIDNGATATSETAVFSWLVGDLRQMHDIIIDGFEFRNAQSGVLSNHATNLVVKNCTFHDMTGFSGWGASAYCIYDNNGTNNTYTNNVFRNCLPQGEAEAFWLTGGCSGVTIANNLVHDFGGNGVSCLAAIGGSSGTKVLNNTCVGTSNLVRPFAGSSGTVVANNIIVGATESGIGNWDGTGALTNSHNLFHNCAANYGGSARAGLNEFTADPLFIGSGNYHLQTSSPAVNTGIDVGLAFTGPAPDLGYAETTSTTAPGYVAGTVTNDSSNPVPGVRIAISNGAAAVSGPDGTYRVPLAPGQYTLTPEYPFGATPASAVANIVAGTTTQQDFVIASNPTYYVDANTGLDSNAGTQALPWRSIDNGDIQGLLNPGDTVIVNPGVYNVQKIGTGGIGGIPYIVLITRSGIEGDPITYKAAGPGVVIDGGATTTVDGLLTGWLVGDLNPIHDVVIDGFEFKGVACGTLANAATRVTVKNCSFHSLVGTPPFGASCYAAYDSNGTDNVYAGNVFYNSFPANEAVGIWLTNGCSGTTIAKNLVYGFKGNGVSTLTAVGGSSGTRILNNTVDGVSNLVRPWGGSSGTVVTNNIIVNALESGIGNWDGLQAVTNSYNLFYNCATNYSGSASAGPGEFTADPMFIGGGNYRLQAGSPAIDAGVDVGLPFTGLKPDLGAFEGTTVTPVDKASIADVKDTPDGILISLTTPSVVVATPGTFVDGSFSVEDSSRISGIKVIGTGSAGLGDRVTLTGVTGTLPGGERALLDAEITGTTAGTALVSLGMTGKSLDSKFTGMLVTVWGKVTFVAADGSYAYINDGSDVSDGNAGGHLGVRVILSGLTTPLTKNLATNPLPFASVTGIAGLGVDGTTSIDTVRPRGDSDIALY